MARARGEDRKVNPRTGQYPDLVASPLCKFIVLAHEIGGHMSPDARDLLLALAKARARTVPRTLRRSSELAFFLRWQRLVSVSAQVCTVSHLLAAGFAPSPLGSEPFLCDVLTDARVADPAPESRLGF